MTIHLAHGILERNGCILLAASRYPNQPEALWNLPGGRQRSGELLDETLKREFCEETSLVASVRRLRYVSESYDGATGDHFVSMVFDVVADGEARLSGVDAHVVDLAWVPRDELAARLTVAVVRQPLVEHFADECRRYFAFPEAGITIRFSDFS
jgi:ADP-ribose pyrophosphatase YjhB (NUDIX family)